MFARAFNFFKFSFFLYCLVKEHSWFRFNLHNFWNVSIFIPGTEWKILSSFYEDNSMLFWGSYMTIFFNFGLWLLFYYMFFHLKNCHLSFNISILHSHLNATVTSCEGDNNSFSFFQFFFFKFLQFIHFLSFFGLFKSNLGMHLEFFLRWCFQNEQKPFFFTWDTSRIPSW